MIDENLHCDTCHTVGRVPEAYGTCVLAALRRDPWHNEQQNLDEDEQADSDVPCFELRSLETELAALTPDQIQTHSHGEEEHRLRIILKVDDCKIMSASLLISNL